jgi:Right handed beta helix region
MKKHFAILLLSLCLVVSSFGQKLTSLSGTSAPAAGDILYVVVNPATTPADRKVTIDDLFKSRTGNNSVLAYASLAAAVSAIGSSAATVEIIASTAVTSSLTVPSNITLQVQGVGVFNISSGQTLTINGPLLAPLRQIFSGSGSVVIGGAVEAVCPQWWGAKANAKQVTDGAMSSSSATLTSATAAFTSADVGKLVDVSRVGASTTLRAVITGYTSATVVTLRVPASYTGSSKTITLDGATIATGSMTAGSATLTAGSSFFTSDDVGKMLSVTDVGAKNLTGTISGYTNATTVTLSFSASVAATATTATYGTNDRAAIAEAVAALPNGGEVYFPKGGYAVGSALGVSASNLQFSGAGMNASVLYSIGPKMLDSGSVFHLIDITQPASNIHFEKLGFSGTNWHGQTTTFGADSADGVFMGVTGPMSNISADNCRFDNFWGIGFHNPGSAGATIAASNAVKNISITKCYSSFNSYDGLNCNPIAGLTVSDCYLSYNGTAGLEASTSQATITGNKAWYNFQGGMSVGGYGGTDLSSAVAVTGNSCQYNGNYGIDLASNQSTTTVVGNICRANGDIGILLDAGGYTLGTNSIIASNVIASNGRLGIQLGHDNVLVQGNKIYNQAMTGYSQIIGIVVLGTNNKIRWNDVYGHSSQDYNFPQTGTINELTYSNSPSVFIGSGATVTHGDPVFDSVAANFKPNTSTGTASFGIDASGGSALTIANNATAAPFGNSANFAGLIIVNDPSVTGATGVFLATNFGMTKIAGSGMSTTAATASSTNVYYNGSNAVEIENKTGGSVNYRVLAIRMRTSP